MLSGYEPGMGVNWNDHVDDDDDYDIAYGVIMDVAENGLYVLPVFAADDSIICYDEGGAVRSKHEHNVRLKGCPPPFCFLSIKGNGSLYSKANPENLMLFTEQSIHDLKADVIDDGDKVPDEVMAELRSHPWRDEMERCEPVEQPERRLSDAYYAVRAEIERSRLEDDGTNGGSHKKKTDFGLGD